MSQIHFYPTNQSVHLPYLIQLLGSPADLRNTPLWWLNPYINRAWVLAPQARIEAFPSLAHLHGCYIPQKAVRPHSEDLSGNLAGN